MLALVVLGALVLVPTVSTYVEQRQKIAALEESVQLTQSEIDALEDEQQRWGDEAYIMAQARERLYYTKPGEVPYLIVNDLDESEQPQDAEPISDEVEEARSDWGGQLLRSITEAGLSERAAAE
ncbi:Cell division protein DivIC (FtsB), stabilizes FtsL against RasP cleavage [Frigoribacterium sp. JB110]|nr:Cell division protein DivIC (FtsB), stabilizes FtsL against RasP cleavage [Frigoribacterium sp. JB110]